MALVIRRYVEAGPGNPALVRFVDATAIAVERFPLPVCDIQIDDAPGNFATLDDFMRSLGYHFQPTDQVISVFQRAADPPVPTLNRVFLYGKTIAGVTRLFALHTSGAIQQLTPAQNLSGYIRGFSTSFGSVSTVSIGVGSARANSDAADLTLAAPAVVNITVAGVNGLDTGVEAANTWYYIYGIGDSTGVAPTAGILSASSAAPVLPAGYDVFRRVGSVRNNAASDFRDFFAFGNGETRSVQYRGSIGTRQVLTGGAALVVTAVPCANLIPTTSQYGRFQYQQSGVSAVSFYDDPTNPLANPQRTLFALAGASVCDLMRTSVAREIAYSNAIVGGLVDIWVTGYEETI